MPIGPYQDFGSCVRAQRNKGRSEASAQRICGFLEQRARESRREGGAIEESATAIKYEENDHLYIKAFLMDSSENINKWGVNPSSLKYHVSSFIGKPLVLTEDFEHPMPLDNTDTEVNDIVDHWLAYQENFRIGNIIDVTEKRGTYYAIIEVTDAAAKDAFRQNDIPLFVSPAIAQLDPREDPANISNWTGIHLALVSNPAYTIKKAIVTGQCRGDGDKCLLQLRQASVINKDSKQKTLFGCGFCRTKALVRYASLVEDFTNITPTKKVDNVDEFLNSSLEFSESQNTLSTMSASESEEQKKQNNNNDKKEENNTTTTTTEETKTTKLLEETAKKVNPSGRSHEGKNINPETGQPFAGSSPSSSSSLTADELGVRVAGMEECVQIFVQNGVAQDQSVQICKLAAKALMENQQQQQSTGGDRPSPGISGQYGSVAEYEKEIAKQELKIGQLMEELKHYKKDDKTDTQRIAELEDTVSRLNRTIKEKDIENYLVTKIADSELRDKKVKRFAELNMTLEDLKDIYEMQDPKVAVKPKTASVESSQQRQQELNPIAGKVKLQVASTSNNNGGEDSSGVTEIRERNNRISSLLSKKEFR